MTGLRFLLKHYTFLVSIIALCVGQVATLAQAQDYVAVEGTEVPDSVFLKKSHEVIFPVNRTILLPKYKKLLEDTVAVGLRHMGDSGVVLGRAAASPEGPLSFNKRLAIGRMQSIKDYLEQLGVETTRIKFDTVYEDCQLLVEMMRQKEDIFYTRVHDIVSTGVNHVGNVYGGGNIAYIDNGTPRTVTVNIPNVNVSGSVFGGGKGKDAVIVGSTNVNIGVWSNTTGTIINGDVFGGGDEAAVEGDCNITIRDCGTQITGDLYGGGNQADVTGKTNVTIGLE